MVFGYYFGNFKLGQVYCSKLRKDKHPSTGFYISKSGKLVYNDLAKKKSYDCFAFVSALYNLSFSDTINKVAFDFGLISGRPKPAAEQAVRQLKDFDKKFKKDTKITWVSEPWDNKNHAFWKDYHITPDELRAEPVFPIKKLFINDIFIPNADNEPRYALTLKHKGEMLTKLYAPLSKEFKWVTNISLDIPFGLSTLRYDSEFSFTAKAVKDKIIAQKFLKSVIAAQNESRTAMPDSLISKLNFHFNENYLSFDNDETGLEAAAELEPLGFIPIYTPVGIKDISDLCKVKGIKTIEELFKTNGLL